jgi:hypothetical protein
LSNFEGLASLVSIGGQFFLVDNPALASLTGLYSLTSIGERLFIGGNNVLSSLTGMENVTSVGGDFVIENNDSLTTLNGLENLTLIAGDIIIGGDFLSDGNLSLQTLSGLDNIDAGTIENIEIRHNSSLSVCHVQSICDYFASPNGTIVISDNAPGCNNQQEVEEACETVVNVDELNVIESFTISPNPCSSVLRIRFMINDQRFVILDLFEISGMKIKRLLNEKIMPGTHDRIIDLIDLNPGIYFCTLKTSEGTTSKKIIKL